MSNVLTTSPNWRKALTRAKANRKRRARRRRQRAKAPDKAAEAVREGVDKVIGLPEGAKWVVREGGLDGPTDDRILPWWDGVGGLHVGMGIWHPWKYLGDHRILWRRLIYPASEPTPMEALAQIGMEGEE